MKHIKLLFIISAISFTAKVGNAQAVVYDSTNYLSLYYQTHYIYTQYATKITRKNLDSTWFTSKNEIFLAIGKKVYLKDSFLLFDYERQIGDTFVYHYGDTTHQKTYVIDSIKSKTLFNNKSYRHFYCRSLNIESRMVYIEGLGEQKFAWGDGSVGFPPEQYGVVGICIGGNEVVKWSSRIKLKEKDIEPTCNFDSIRNLSSVKTLQNQGISVYPNPANKVINFGRELAGEYFILNPLGQIVSSGKFSNEISIENLLHDLYFLQIKTDQGEWLSAKILKTEF